MSLDGAAGDLEGMVRDLKAMGMAFTVLETGSDGALLIAPECGRVLGLWPHWRGENALWVDPGFLGALAAGTKDEEWRCPGGDRMWLAPAAEFLEDGRTPPPSLDPGRWEPQPGKGFFSMENSGDAWAWKSGVRVGFRIHRRIRPLGEAEMEERWGVTWLRRAGYEEEAGLELTEGRLADARLWNTVRVRSGSEWRSARGLIGATLSASRMSRTRGPDMPSSLSGISRGDNRLIRIPARTRWGAARRPAGWPGGTPRGASPGHSPCARFQDGRRRWGRWNRACAAVPEKKCACGAGRPEMRFPAGRARATLE